MSDGSKADIAVGPRGSSGYKLTIAQHKIARQKNSDTRRGHTKHVLVDEFY